MKSESISRNGHRFYPCPLFGDQHPSITTILDVISSPPLLGWMAKNGTAKLSLYHESALGVLGEDVVSTIDKIAEEKWVKEQSTAFWKSGRTIGKEAADDGTMAHAWVEADLSGKEIGLETLSAGARNAVEAYLAWKKDHRLETIKTEQTFYNCKLNYAGTADWVGMLDGELTLGDWKTSSGIFFNYVVQAWGYALADEMQNADRLYKQVMIGRFGKDGVPEVKIFKRNEFPSIETARDILIACGHIFQALHEWDSIHPRKKRNAVN